MGYEKLKNRICLVLVLVFLTVFAGCARQEPQEKVILDFYKKFCALYYMGPEAAIKQYVHYENEEIIPIAIESATTNKTVKYKVLGAEQVSGELWAVKLYYETLAYPQGKTAYNFVGRIDGEYKVMRSVSNIPEALRQGLDLDAYLPTGEYIDPEDVFIETPIQKTE